MARYNQLSAEAQDISVGPRMQGPNFEAPYA
jgi:hypothetical protein